MARKGENIFKRKDGRWEARYVKQRDINGKVLKYGYVYGKSYIDVKRKKEIAIENSKNEILIMNKDNSSFFSVSIINWLNSKNIIKDTTYYNYYSIINGKLIPFFKDIKLTDINKSLIVEFTRKLKLQKLSSKRIKDILLLLNQFLQDQNINIKMEYPVLQKKNISILTNDEISVIEKDTLQTTDIKKFATLLTLFTGLRIGELCALQWKDIDLERKVIHITKNIIRTKSDESSYLKTETKIDTPKTVTSIRDIPIKDELISYLKAFQKEKNIFLLTEGNFYMSPNKYYYFYRKYFEDLNIVNYKFHTLRHTFATRSLSFGMDIKTLSVILGHTSVKITLDLYVHITEEEKRKQINKIPLFSLQ